MSTAAVSKSVVQLVYGYQLGITGSPVFKGHEPYAHRVALVIKVLEDVQYRDWVWRLVVNGGEFTITSSFYVDDSTTGERVQLSFVGTTFPSDGLSDADLEKYILRAAWDAVRAFALHEAAEWFRYKGVMIHDPHKKPEWRLP